MHVHNPKRTESESGFCIEQFESWLSHTTTKGSTFVLISIAFEYIRRNFVVGLAFHFVYTFAFVVISSNNNNTTNNKNNNVNTIELLKTHLAKWSASGIFKVRFVRFCVHLSIVDFRFNSNRTIRLYILYMRQLD